MGKLDGKVAIVTGGSRGMGKATTEIFIQEGATVFIADILDAQGEDLAKELGPAASYYHLDVTKEVEWQDLVKKINEKHGRIDILVNNAAIVHTGAIEETEITAFHQVLEVNLIGPYLGMKAIIPSMKKAGKGSIVNISSVSGLTGHSESAAYCSSKWGLRGLTKSVAMQAGPFGIRVNSVHPGAVDTPMLNPERNPIEGLKDMFPGVALCRVARPEEIARASLFLASDDASYVSGAELAVDGAWTCGSYLGPKPSP